MEWNEILISILPYVISILSVIVTAVLSYYKVVNWDPSIVEGVLAKIAEAILKTEVMVKDNDGIMRGPGKLELATELAVSRMNKEELKIMKQIGKKAKVKAPNWFMGAVQNVFTNSAQNLLEYGVKKGINKVIKDN